MIVYSFKWVCGWSTGLKICFIWSRWNKLIQKPFEGGDERGLKLVQSILKPIMLRRTKHSTDREGKSVIWLKTFAILTYSSFYWLIICCRPILVLPPADTQVIYCEPTEAEKDFYGALFKRSKVFWVSNLNLIFSVFHLIFWHWNKPHWSNSLMKFMQVKFDQFVEQGRVLHNYASILELLLRLRQCCDHPFLVMRYDVLHSQFLLIYLNFVPKFCCQHMTTYCNCKHLVWLIGF